MSDPRNRQRQIIRDLPDVTAARQEESKRNFQDTVKYFNKQMFKLGLCDGNKCRHHKVTPGVGRNACYCRRALKSRNLKTKKYWEKMHWENCSAGRSMEKNLGCRGFQPEGLPLYQEAIIGRKVV